jgi:uncharacterized protein (DUF58 family)
VIAEAPTSGRGAFAALTRRRCLPGRRLLWLVGLGMLPLLAAPLWTGVVWVVAAFDLALLLGMGVDYWNLSQDAHLRLRRAREARLSAGADNPITLEIEHLGRGGVRLWARDGYPGEFEAAGDDLGTNDELTLGQALRPRLLALGRRRRELRSRLDGEDRDLSAEEVSAQGAQGLRRRLARELTPGGALGPGLALEGGQRLQVTYQVTPLRRGDVTFGAAFVRVESWLGLATLAAEADLQETARVYPNLRGVQQLGLAARLRDLQALGLKSSRRDGAGGEFEKLRDYVQGDSLRDIDWKATARRQKPITQVYQTERSQAVLLCIDAGRLMSARCGELSKLDHAVNAALLLAWAALQGGDRVGLAVFGQELQVWLEPAAGQAQYRRLLEALTLIEARPEQADYAALVKQVLTRMRRRGLVVILTDLYDEHTARPLVSSARLLATRHLPLCVTLRDEHLHAAAGAIPQEADQLYERAVATEVMREREVLKGELARLGARVIDSAPEALTVEVINAYIEARRGGR